MAENVSLPALPSFDIETDKANAGLLNHVKMSITRRIKMFTDTDIFITNTTSTYEDIPIYVRFP
jgi:hypothetical protein